MTPFRNYVAITGAAVATVVARQLQLNNGMRSYISVCYFCNKLVTLMALCCMDVQWQSCNCKLLVTSPGNEERIINMLTAAMTCKVGLWTRRY